MEQSCGHDTLIVKIPEIHTIESHPIIKDGHVALEQGKPSESEVMGEIGVACTTCGINDWYEDVANAPQWVKDLYYADYV